MPGVSRPTSLLSAAPAVLPAFLATLVFSVWATREAGYLTTDWYPGALFLVALLEKVLRVFGRLDNVERHRQVGEEWRLRAR